MIKNIFLLLFFILPFFISGDYTGNNIQQETAHRSLQEQNEGYYYFEGVFLSYDEVLNAAKMNRMSIPGILSFRKNFM